jgi:hypothetical protein
LTYLLGAVTIFYVRETLVAKTASK